MYGDKRNIFWFEKGKNGNPVLVKPDGSRNWINDDPTMYKSIRDKHAYRRTKLVMEEYGIWDATALGATMCTIFMFKDPNKENVYYAFSSVQDVHKNINPYLSARDIEACKKYVDSFYNNPNLQAGWTGIILHPICIKIIIENNAIIKIPYQIKDISSNFSYIEKEESYSISSLDDQEILETINI